MAEIPEVEIVENFVPGQEPEQLKEIPNKIRFLVEGSPNLESKIATLKKFYPDVQIDTNESNNFIVTDESGNKLQLDNKKKTNFGDLIDISIRDYRNYSFNRWCDCRFCCRTWRYSSWSWWGYGCWC